MFKTGNVKTTVKSETFTFLECTMLIYLSSNDISKQLARHDILSSCGCTLATRAWFEIHITLCHHGQSRKVRILGSQLFHIFSKRATAEKSCIIFWFGLALAIKRNSYWYHNRAPFGSDPLQVCSRGMMLASHDTMQTILRDKSCAPRACTRECLL